MDEIDAARLEAERIAREAEEARRRAVLAEISALEGERGKYQDLKDNVVRLGSELGNAFDEYLSSKNNGKILADAGDFDGKTAGKISESFEEAETEVNRDQSAIEASFNDNSVQAGRISKKINDIDSKINMLRATL